MENLELNTTIIIPTLNRVGHLFRLINYYSTHKYFSYFEFIIVDSGNNKSKQLNSKFFNKKNFRNIQYVKMNSNIRFVRKMYNALKIVKTKYVCFCADDDLIFLESILRSEKILDNDLETVSIRGKFYNFTFNDDLDNTNYKKYDLEIFTEYDDKSYKSISPYDRISIFLKDYQSLYYGVHRLDTLTKIFGYMTKINSYCYSEIFQSVSLLFSGKIDCVSGVLGCRQSCNPVELNRKNWETTSWFCTKPKQYIKEYFLYSTILINFLKKELKFDLKNSDINQINSIHLNFLIPNLYSTNKFNKKFLSRIFIKISNYIQKKFNNIVNFEKPYRVELLRYINISKRL